MTGVLEGIAIFLASAAFLVLIAVVYYAIVKCLCNVEGEFQHVMN